MKYDRNCRESGLSLIELMLAITLGLMIIVSLGYIMQGSRATYLTQDASAKVQDTGRFAMDFISRQIRAAGRTDITPLASDGRIGLDLDITPITGTASALTVQYQLSEMGGNSIQDCNGDKQNELAGLPTIPGTTLHYGMVRNVISKNDTNLQCAGNGTAGGGQPFAENVEDIQFLYAIDSNGDQAVDSWTTNPANSNQIVAVQVCILVRSPNMGALNASQSIANCTGGQSASDTRLRRTFTSVFTLRNRVTVLPQ